jgi:FKBP-type peptidyl-prolyl cis-trans isomerase FkpA
MYKHQLRSFSIFLAIFVLIAMAATTSRAADKADSDEEKTLYAVGLVIARQLTVFNITPAELEIVMRGISDASAGKKPEVDLAAYGEKIQQLAQARRKIHGEKLAAGNKEFLENAAKEKDAVKTESGLVFIPVKKGEGISPGSTDLVKVNYRGTLPDGKEFDSSYKRSKAFEFRLDGVIKCWTEGLKMMNVGGKARLVCPPNIAYGDAGAGELILPGATLVFDVELLEVKPDAKQGAPAMK